MDNDLGQLKPLLIRTSDILSQCDFLESSETSQKQSAEESQYQQLNSRFTDAVANVSELTDQLTKASSERETILVSLLPLLDFALSFFDEFMKIRYICSTESGMK